MAVSLQLFLFFVSFLFGLAFYMGSSFHLRVSVHYSKFWKVLSTFLFMVDVVLFYLLLLYQLCEGVFHLYFLFFVILGYFFGKTLHKNVKLKRKKIQFIEKHKQK